tara:strand:- start:32960 stop:33757 length:798 start_codon:yes stop_codon:yes gene_type:complete
MSKIKKQKKYLIKIKANKPFFSVITVVKNAEKDVIKTIKSVKNQTYKNYEYIVIDGNSEDHTVKNVLRYRKNINLFISENDKGIYYAMNKGINFSRGKIIIFVNSGDILTKNALKNVNEIFNKNKKYDYVFGTVKRHYTKDTILKYGVNVGRLKYNFDFATSHSTGFFLKKKIFQKYGLFNTKYKCSADYDLYYRLIIKKKIEGSSTKKSKLIGIVQSGGYSSKISFFSHLKEETLIRINNNQNLFFVSLIFINAVIKHFFKYFK